MDSEAERLAEVAAARIDIREAKKRAKVAAEHGRWNECEKELSHILDTGSLNDPNIYSIRSHAFLKQGKVTQALADADRAVAMAPLSARAHNACARALVQAGEHTNAGKKLCHALNLSPRYFADADERFEEMLGGIGRSRPYFPGVPRLEAKRVLASTPPPKGSAPDKCRSLAVREVTCDSLRATWDPPESDGGDEIFKYEVQVATIDPLQPDEPLDFQLGFSGFPVELEVVLSNLEADTEIVMRVAATNGQGRGEWSDQIRCTTEKYPRQARELDTRIPQSWLDLRANMSDLFASVRKAHGIDEDAAWEELLEVWRNHLGDLKLAYRLYVLLESTEPEPKDINLGQFRRFVQDCRIAATKTETDLIFVRVNRVSTNDGGKSPVAQDSRIQQDEFVHAILRLGILQASKMKRAVCSLAQPFAAIMSECVLPHAVLRRFDDQLGELLRGRAARAVLAKHSDALLEQYKRWSEAENEISGRSPEMSLNELITALKEARVLDEKCTAREVTSFFVTVNADDETYRKRSSSGSSTTLDFDEFLEIIARICNEKIPNQRDDVAFEQSLDTWLGLILIPSLRNAGKVQPGKVVGAARKRTKGIRVQSSSQANKLPQRA